MVGYLFYSFFLVFTWFLRWGVSPPLFFGRGKKVSLFLYGWEGFGRIYQVPVVSFNVWWWGGCCTLVVMCFVD